jgi:hypothetical protein
MVERPRHCPVDQPEHIQYGIPVSHKDVCDRFFAVDFHVFKETGKNKLDFGEVCILDTRKSWHIG